MLDNAQFIINEDIQVEDRNSWNNMGFNAKSKPLTDKGGIPCFSKSFDIKKDIHSAALEATALGVFDVFINNTRTGEITSSDVIYDELKPGWTDYSHRVFSFTYDVTQLLRKGENEIFAEVSCGWYSCRISFGIYGFKKPAFCCCLHIVYTDGTDEYICTDESWQTALCGPVRTADIWDGEFFDAREKRALPSCAKYAKAEHYDGEIVPARQPRILVRKELELHPVHAWIFDGVTDNGTDFGEINAISTSSGAGCEICDISADQHLILDMGQNSVGRPHIRIKAKRGTRLTFYFGELLNDSGSESRGNDGPKGSVYVKNYRSALSRFVYVTGSDDTEDYAPRHTFFGYRYLEIETTDDVKILSVRAEVVGSANKETAEFSCSDDDVNKLWSNIVWGQRSNYLSIPTDCPQRDERLGWTGDTHIFCGAGSYIADIYDFMSKWLQDARDTQDDDGGYCDVIPKVFQSEKFKGNAAWTDAGIIVPYVMYIKYGRADILREHFASMEKYMEYLSQYGLEGGNLAYGDWLCYEETDKRYIAICYYANDAHIMAYCAEALGYSDKALRYKKLEDDIKAHFAEKYIHNGELTEKTQTGYLLALKFDMLPNDLRERARLELRSKIEGNDYTLSTGFVGTGALCMTLAENGMSDLCYSLLLQTKDPSWLYSVKQGATTVWERWNSYTIEKGFGNVNMNSFNHYAYGAVAEWMMSGMAGIGSDTPGFFHPVIAPVIDSRKYIPTGQKRIEHVSASYSSAHGLIKSSWRLTADGCLYEIEVPVRSTLRIELFGKTAYLNGKPVTARNTDYLTLDVDSGRYIIEVG